MLLENKPDVWLLKDKERIWHLKLTGNFFRLSGSADEKFTN
jgi:hypothetical protein